MSFRSAARVLMALAVTTAMAQNVPQATVPGGTEIIGQRRGPVGRPAGMQNRGVPTPTPLRQRVQDMEGTLAQMHLVLEQMRNKAAKSPAKDSLAKGNLDMWKLMVGQLEKELQELRVAMAVREDMEARRAALYKQADVKAEAEAQAARAETRAERPGRRGRLGRRVPPVSPGRRSGRRSSSRGSAATPTTSRTRR